MLHRCYIEVTCKAFVGPALPSVDKSTAVASIEIALKINTLKSKKPVSRQLMLVMANRSNVFGTSAPASWTTLSGRECRPTSLSSACRQRYRGAWRLIGHAGQGHEELLPDQPRVLLHAAGGQRRQRQVLVPVAHVVHGDHLRPGGLHAAAAAGDGHPAVAGHALPRGRVRRLRLPPARIRARLPGQLPPGIRLLASLYRPASLYLFWIYFIYIYIYNLFLPTCLPSSRSSASTDSILSSFL